MIFAAPKSLLKNAVATHVFKNLKVPSSHPIKKNISHLLRNVNFKRKSEGEKPGFFRLEKL